MHPCTDGCTGASFFDPRQFRRILCYIWWLDDSVEGTWTQQRKQTKYPLWLFHNPIPNTVFQIKSIGGIQNNSNFLVCHTTLATPSCMHHCIIASCIYLYGLNKCTVFHFFVYCLCYRPKYWTKFITKKIMKKSFVSVKEKVMYLLHHHPTRDWSLWVSGDIANIYGTAFPRIKVDYSSIFF